MSRTLCLQCLWVGVKASLRDNVGAEGPFSFTTSSCAGCGCDPGASRQWRPAQQRPAGTSPGGAGGGWPWMRPVQQRPQVPSPAEGLFPKMVLELRFAQHFAVRTGTHHCSSSQSSVCSQIKALHERMHHLTVCLPCVLLSAAIPTYHAAQTCRCDS